MSKEQLDEDFKKLMLESEEVYKKQKFNGKDLLIKKEIKIKNKKEDSK